MALGPLTINYERERLRFEIKIKRVFGCLHKNFSVVSFTKPFLNLGVSILFLKPEPSDPGPFSFLAPLGNSGPVKGKIINIFIIQELILILTALSLDVNSSGFWSSLS